MVMMYRTRRLPWRNSFPRSGSCCVSNNPRGFLYLSAGYCCHWQDWPTCKVSPSKKKKKRKKTCPFHSGMDDTCLVPCVIRSCPLGRDVPYLSLALEKQLPPEWVVLCTSRVR